MGRIVRWNVFRINRDEAIKNYISKKTEVMNFLKMYRLLEMRCVLKKMRIKIDERIEANTLRIRTQKSIFTLMLKLKLFAKKFYRPGKSVDDRTLMKIRLAITYRIALYPDTRIDFNLRVLKTFLTATCCIWKLK